MRHTFPGHRPNPCLATGLKIHALQRRTRTDISLCLVGSHSLEAKIDSRKLQLFGQFCRLRIDHWLRHVFINRMTAFFVNGASQTGFIPDVVRLCTSHLYPPATGDMGGIAGLKCRSLTCDVSRQCQGCAGVLTSRQYSGEK